MNYPYPVGIAGTDSRSRRGFRLSSTELETFPHFGTPLPFGESLFQKWENDAILFLYLDNFARFC